MNRWLASLAALALIGSATAQTQGVKPVTPREPPVWDRLERFSSDAELMQYIRDVQRIGGVRGLRIGIDSGVADAVPPPPSPPPAAAAPSPQASTGASQEASSITNVQTQGVDEGGIVKMVGRFLITLQDGRLFVTDTRPNGQAGLQLVSRTNVYRDPNAGTWYDELLTSGNRVLVTGYSYQEGASEVSVFALSETGQLTREAVYYISSNDYYDVENYSTRLVNGNLVIYTPLNLAYVNPDSRIRWPLIRRWLRDDQRRAVTTSGRPLFDAQDIYKPIQATTRPFVHSVSVCPLGDLRQGDELECRTTAFVGPSEREFFVSTTDIYLWVTPGYGDYRTADCPDGARPAPDAFAQTATLYQVPLSGQSPRAAHVRGRPDSQLALDADTNEFRALLGWNTSQCNRSAGRDLRYFRLPLNALSTRPRAAPASSYTAVPRLDTTNYEVRFTGTHVVYGGRRGHGSFPTSADIETARVVAVPLTRPSAAVTLEAPHSILRIERAGADIVLTGYRNDEGLSLSLVDLAARPRIASTQLLRGRFEAENRSHAFNALIGADGSGLMGLPTVLMVKEAGRWVSRSDASDLSYIAVNPAGQLSDAGELTSNPRAQHPSYRCEVSCVDWYGNTRALYIGARVFALSGTELVEGALTDGRVGELRRINLSAPPPNR